MWQYNERKTEWEKCSGYVQITQIKLVFPTYANLTFITITMIGFQKGSKYVVVGKMRFVKENKQVMLMNNWPIQNMKILLLRKNQLLHKSGFIQTTRN